MNLMDLVPSIPSLRFGASAQSYRRILVVDDEESIRNVVEEHLGNRGYAVTTVASAGEALQYLDESPVALVIIDIVMREINGFSLLERIKTNHPHLPAILFTGLGFDEELLQEARSKGACGFVNKGLPLSQLLFEVHRVLDYSS